jgi:diguanylate cyclase (GGDEF)-like protein
LDIGREQILWALGGSVVGYLLSLQIEQVRARMLARLRDREREEADKALNAARREVLDGNHKLQEHSEVFQKLPEIIDEMFRVASRRAVGPALLKLVDALFRPEQIAIFVARPAQRRLVLVDGNGLPASLAPGTEVEYGHGRVGIVAEHRAAMDESDFKGKRPAGDPPGLRADALAAIASGELVYGIVTVGGVRMRRGLEKKLLSMAAGLANVAGAHAEMRAESESASSRDGMTGLLNRRALEDRLDAEVAKVEKQKGRLSVLMLDVDDFRHYNQTNGHQQGDDLLRRLAALLKSSVRSDDVVARFGGEEMVVVFPGADKDTAVRLSEQLRAAVEEFPFAFRGLQPQGKVTISGGVASYPDDARGGRELVRCADQAMVEAKQGGRNRVLPAQPTYLA